MTNLVVGFDDTDRFGCLRLTGIEAQGAGFKASVPECWTIGGRLAGAAKQEIIEGTQSCVWLVSKCNVLMVEAQGDYHGRRM